MGIEQLVVKAHIATEPLWKTAPVKKMGVKTAEQCCLTAGAAEVGELAAYRRLRSRVVGVQELKLGRSEIFW